MSRRLILLLTLLLGVGGFALWQGKSPASPQSLRDQWPQKDFSKKSVPLSQFRSGGPGKDGIPSIDEPQFTPAHQADVEARSPVLSLTVNGDSRAYPLAVMMFHEIVNDRVGGVPVAVTFCPLCNSGIAFRRRLGDRVLEFGTTGLLRNSDLVMYDRQTESWWQQYTGKAVVGELTGSELASIPVRMEAFQRFRERQPGAKVLVPTRTWGRRYGQTPYTGYDRRERPMLYSGPLPENVHPMARVVVVDDQAWTLALLRERREIQHRDLVIRWSPGQASALDSAEIAEGRDVGNVTVRRRTSEGMANAAHKIVFAFAFRAFQPDATLHTR